MGSAPTRPSRVTVEIPPTVLAAPFVPMADFMNEILRRSEVKKKTNKYFSIELIVLVKIFDFVGN